MATIDFASSTTHAKCDYYFTLSLYFIVLFYVLRTSFVPFSVIINVGEIIFAFLFVQTEEACMFRKNFARYKCISYHPKLVTARVKIDPELIIFIYLHSLLFGSIRYGTVPLCRKG